MKVGTCEIGCNHVNKIWYLGTSITREIKNYSKRHLLSKFKCTPQKMSTWMVSLDGMYTKMWHIAVVPRNVILRHPTRSIFVWFITITPPANSPTLYIRHSICTLNLTTMHLQIIKWGLFICLSLGLKEVGKRQIYNV